MARPISISLAMSSIGEKLDREAEESKNVYRGNAIFGGAISQNGSSQTGSDANRSTSQTAAAGNVGESTNANSAAQAGGMAVSSTGKAYYNPGKERSKIQKRSKRPRRTWQSRKKSSMSSRPSS